MSDLRQIVNNYFLRRGYKDPTLDEAFLFLVSEIGELSDALVSSRQEWVRNNPDKKSNIAQEIGDVLMMLVKVGEKAGIDDIANAMLYSMELKIQKAIKDRGLK